jgi:hypothetical protein
MASVEAHLTDDEMTTRPDTERTFDCGEQP